MESDIYGGQRAGIQVATRRNAQVLLGRKKQDGSRCCSYPKYPAEDAQRRLSPLLCSQPIVVINLITVEADGLLVREFEVCESMKEEEEMMVVLLEQEEQLCLLYWSWIGDSSLLVLNRGMEHLCDVDDHIWTWTPIGRLSARQSVETIAEAKGSEGDI